MFYIFYGNDTAAARSKVNELVTALRGKKPDAGVFRFEAEDFSSEEIEHLTEAKGLFESNHIVILDNVFEDRENAEAVKDYAEQMKDSEHIFILLESSAEEKTIKELRKKADSIQSFEDVDSGKKSGKEEFNIFDIADALGKKDRKKLWMMFQEARKHEIPAEEIFGILFWQIKSMLLAGSVDTAEKAGMKPYPFRKSKSFLHNFTHEELLNLSSELIYRYHQSRAGSGEGEIELEKFILSV